jgi:hypothetical protein
MNTRRQTEYGPWPEITRNQAEASAIIESEHAECSSIIELKRSLDKFLVRYREALAEHLANCQKKGKRRGAKK